MLGGASPKIPNLIPADIEFAGNHLYKPLAWRTPIVPTPAGRDRRRRRQRCAPRRHVLLSRGGRASARRRTRGPTRRAVPRSPSRSPPAGASRSRGRRSRARPRIASTAGPRPGRRTATSARRPRASSTTARAAGVADTGTWATGTRWAVKNLFELKLGERVRVHGNLMEHCWKESQTGFAVLLTPRNQDAHLAVGVRARRDVHRQSGAACRLRRADRRLRHQRAPARRPAASRSPTTSSTTSTRSGGAAAGAGSRSATGRATSRSITTPSCTTGQAIYVYGGSYGAEMTVANLRFTNNLLKHNTYGIMGERAGLRDRHADRVLPGRGRCSGTRWPGARPRGIRPATSSRPWRSGRDSLSMSPRPTSHLIAGQRLPRERHRCARSRGAGGAGRSRCARGAHQGGTGAPPPVVISTHDAPGRTDGGGVCGDPRRRPAGSATLPLDGDRRRAAAGAVARARRRASSAAPRTQPGTFPITVQAQDAADPPTRSRRPMPDDCLDAARRVADVAAPRGDPRGPRLSRSSPRRRTPDGTVTRVDFYANATMLGSASAAPWSITWPNRARDVPADRRGDRQRRPHHDQCGRRRHGDAVVVAFVVPELVIASVTPSRTSASTAQSVTWTVTAAGGLAPYTYQFWVYNGAEWRLGQDWSPSATWVWTPSTSGTYCFQVWTRSAGSSARLDAFRSFGPFVVRQPAPLTARALTADRAGPMPARTPITWTALASGGTGPYTYQFWVWNGAAWSIGRHWSSSPTWTWIPATAGTYVFQVWIRNAGSAASYDAYRSAGPYIIGNPSALTVSRLAADRQLPVPKGTPVTWTASAAGGRAVHVQVLRLRRREVECREAWSTSPAWTWIPAARGEYAFQVWVRNAGSTASYDAYRSAGPAVILGPSPLAVTAFAVSPTTELATGGPPSSPRQRRAAPVRTTTSSGCSMDRVWMIGQPWSASSTFAWMPPADGTYSMQVWVRNAGSTRRGTPMAAWGWAWSA